MTNTGCPIKVILAKNLGLGWLELLYKYGLELVVPVVETGIKK
jgi:hypothetical protein